MTSLCELEALRTPENIFLYLITPFLRLIPLRLHPNLLPMRIGISFHPHPPHPLLYPTLIHQILKMIRYLHIDLGDQLIQVLKEINEIYPM